MPRRPVRIALIALASPLLLVLGAMLARGQSHVDGRALFEDVRRRVLAAGIDSTLTDDDVWERAARGMVAGLHDPYAGLYSPAELAAFKRNTLHNDYSGVGMQLEDQLGTFVVASVFPRSPAAGAGVQAGDRVVRVDSVATAGLTLDGVTRLLVGSPGTPVLVAFERAGVAEPIEQRFTRAPVHMPAVPYALILEPGIGYVPLQRFSDAAAADLRAAILRLAQQGARRFVLDLRGNPGGSVDESVAVSSLFLRPGQPVVTVRYRGQPEEVERATDGVVLPDAPLVVLVDGRTASAAEIVAGALQDHDRALLVGTTSYGKGVMQSLFPLQQGWGLKLTTAAWLTPSGRSIQRERRAGPDSEETPAMRAARPVFRSDGGRPVLGGGGITPDLIAEADTLSSVEQRFLARLAPRGQQSYAALADYALALRPAVRPDFAVRPEWRSAWRERLAKAGVVVSAAQLDSVAPLVDRLIERKLAALAFGDSSAFRRAARDDAPLRRALGLLRQGTTQAALLAEAGRDRG